MSIAEALDSLLDKMIAAQRGRVQSYAQRINPRLTSDDVLAPYDYPELRDNAPFCYEDGVLAGLLAAQMAIRAELKGSS